MTDDEKTDTEKDMQDKNSENEEDRNPENSISEEIPQTTAEPDRKNAPSSHLSMKALKVNDKIQYRLHNSDDWIRATVIGRAG